MDPRSVIARTHELRALRAPVESQYRSIARLMRPEQSDMFDGNSRINVYDDIFDGTGMAAAESFSGGIFGQLTNPASRWFEFTIQDEDLASYGPVKEWLWAVANVVYASIAPGVSNFYTELPGWFSDLGCFGVGTFYQEEDLGRGRIIDRTIPLSETLFSLDANGEIDEFHRPFKLKGAKAKVKFPELAAMGSRVGDAVDYTFVHAVMRNHDYDPQRIGPAGKPWLSIYCCEGIRDFWRLGGFYENPFATVMWNRRPGRDWPVGPGHVALPDVAMLNEMERAHITAAQFAAEPPILMHDETLVAADIFPNAVLYGQVTDRGQQLVMPMARGSNLQLSMEMSAQRREAVREAFFFSLFQMLKNRPQMTATEFLGFQGEQLRQMAPNLARVQSQGLSPVLSRRFGILERAGQIPPPPEELEGMALDISYVSPLAKLMKADEARAVRGWVLGVGEVAQVTGDTGVLDVIDGDAVAAVLHAANGPPPVVMRSDIAVKQIREERAKLAAQREQLAQRGQEVETAAVAAHAVQASSAASQRGSVQ